MADFCTKCAYKIFGKHANPEINVQAIYESLEVGFVSSGYLCEGCGLIAITKNDNNELKVMKIPDEKNEKLSDWEDY